MGSDRLASDLAACDKYFSEELENFAYPEEALNASLANPSRVAV
jgi:hypothetical protein